MHFENEIEHKILVIYVIAKVSGRLKTDEKDKRASEAIGLWVSDDLFNFYGGVK